MNHPYLYPDECPWLSDYHHLRDLRSGQLLDDIMEDPRSDLAPEPVAASSGPSDDDLDLLVIAIQALRPAPDYSRHDLQVVDKGREILRKWLARFGHQPAPVPAAEGEVVKPASPAEGEVAELVDRLRRASDGADAMGWDHDSWTIARAAELLSQRHPAPVPVSERLPGPGDCLPWPGEPNAGHWCWMASFVDNGWAWEQRALGFLASFPQDFTHWLPATALPLPAGEVE